MSLLLYGLGALGALGVRERVRELRARAREGSDEVAGEGGVYRTALGDVVAGAWLKFETLPGRELLLHPMTSNAADRAAGVVLARMDYAGAEELAKSFGGRIPFLSELEAALRSRSAGIVQASVQTQSAEALKKMATREASIKHDAQARKKFDVLGELFPDSTVTVDGAQRYVSVPYFFTKTWVVLDDDPTNRYVTPAGLRRAPEWGFWTKTKLPESRGGPPYDVAEAREKKTIIQGNKETGYGHHDYNHVDYAMVPSVIRQVK